MPRAGHDDISFCDVEGNITRRISRFQCASRRGGALASCPAMLFLSAASFLYSIAMSGGVYRHLFMIAREITRAYHCCRVDWHFIGVLIKDD